MAANAEALAAKFLADLVKSREQASHDAIAAATTSAAATASTPAPVASQATAVVNSTIPVSQQLATALQAKSDATDELVALIDSGDLDAEKIAALKQQIAELNNKLKLLEAQDAQAKIAAASFPDERVMTSAGPAPTNDAVFGYSAATYEQGMLVDVSPATFANITHAGPPPGYRTRKQREEEERERQRQEAERALKEGMPLPTASGKHMKGDLILSDTTLYVEPNWHTSVSAGPTLECDPLCRSPLESVVVELLKHVRPGQVGRVGLTPDQSSPRAYIHFLGAEPATRLLTLLVPGASKLLCRVGTHEYRVMRAKPKAGQDYILRPVCPQIWIRGTVLPDQKLLQNLSRFGSIIAHTRTAREVTVTFDNEESARKAVEVLPTERQWWGAYINYAQQAQLISLKSTNPLPGVDLVSLEGNGDLSPTGDMDEKPGGGGDNGEQHTMSGPRRHNRRSRHRQPQHRRSPQYGRRSPSPDRRRRSDSGGPIRWPEVDIPAPKKEEQGDPSLSPTIPRDSVLHPDQPRSNADWGARGPAPYRGDDQQRQQERPPIPQRGDYYEPPPQNDGFRGGPPSQPQGYGYPRYDEPYYGPGPPMNNGYGPPSFYNGPPPMDPNYRGPPPMPGYGYPGPGFNGPPPGEFYPPRSGPPGAYVGPNGYPGPPPQHYGGPPPPPGRGNGRFDGPPPRSAGAPYHPPAPHHSPHNAHSAPPTGMSPPYGQDYQQQPPPAQSEEQVPFVKPEPVEASLDNFTPTTSAAAPMRQPPVDFFKSTSLDDRNGEATPTHGANSGWGAPQAANGGEQSTFRPYQSIMSMRR